MLRETATHGFPPLYDEESRILILGSFPSIASRSAAFFYGHPQNRFWPLLAKIFKEEIPKTKEEKEAFAHRHHLALYDSIESCSIVGSSDASIADVEPADLRPIYKTGKIKRIIFNGHSSERWFYRFQTPPVGVEAVCLPSTSPANAASSMERLEEAWRPFLEDAS